MISSANNSSIFDQTEETITEAQKAQFKQQALLKNSVLQHAMITSPNVGIIVTDEDGIIRVFNIGAERMLGYQAYEILNKVTPSHFFDSQKYMLSAEALSINQCIPIPLPFEALILNARQGLDAQGAEYSEELTYIRKDGMRIDVMVSVTTLRDTQNDIIGFVLISTANSRREKAIEQSSQFFALSQEMLAVVGFDGYFKHLNPTWEKALG